MDGHTLSLINTDGLDLRNTVLHGDLARARREEDLARTLDIQTRSSASEAHDDAHRLPLAREGENLQRLRRVADGLVVGPVEVTCHRQERGLGLAPDEDRRAGGGVGVFESCRIECDRVVQELAEGYWNDAVEIAKLHSEAIVMGGRGCLVLFCDVERGALGVLCEVTYDDEAASYGASDDSYLVLGKRAGLVRADNTRASNSFAGAERADEQALAVYAHRSMSESEGYHQG